MTLEEFLGVVGALLFGIACPLATWRMGYAMRRSYRPIRDSANTRIRSSISVCAASACLNA
jgi:hypothetical protein